MRARVRHGRLAGMLVALVGVGGCWGHVPPGSPEFAQGYAEGCDSGYGDAGWEVYYDHRRLDRQAYAERGDYRRGWDEGHKKCYEEEETHPHMSRSGNGGGNPI
jgi:hypothetical protein